MAAEVYAGKDTLSGRELRFRKTRKTEVAAQIELGKLLAPSAQIKAATVAVPARPIRAVAGDQEADAGSALPREQGSRRL